MRPSLFLTLLLLLVTAFPAAACFGPKLYLGTSSGPQSAVLFEVVALYVKEKTGVETVRVDLADEAPLAALRAEKADLVLADGATPAEATLLALDGLPRLVAGRRVLEDLQFTTVAPALRRLARLLTAADVAGVLSAVEGGTPPAAAARRLLMAKGWL